MITQKSKRRRKHRQTNKQTRTWPSCIHNTISLLYTQQKLIKNTHTHAQRKINSPRAHRQINTHTHIQEHKHATTHKRARCGERAPEPGVSPWTGGTLPPHHLTVLFITMRQSVSSAARQSDTPHWYSPAVWRLAAQSRYTAGMWHGRTFSCLHLGLHTRKAGVCARARTHTNTQTRTCVNTPFSHTPLEK